MTLSLMTSLPSIITIQCTGRTNSRSLEPQRIRLGMGKDESDFDTISATNSAVALPATSFLKTSHSPLSVFMRSRSATSTPQEPAKPCAARLGLPSSSNAACTAGPLRSTNWSSCRTGIPFSSTAKRRGAA